MVSAGVLLSAEKEQSLQALGRMQWRRESLPHRFVVPELLREEDRF